MKAGLALAVGVPLAAVAAAVAYVPRWREAVILPYFRRREAAERERERELVAANRPPPIEAETTSAPAEGTAPAALRFGEGLEPVPVASQPRETALRFGRWT